MRILILNTGRGWGGIETHSVSLARALIDLGHEVVLGCRFGRVVHANAVEQAVPVVNIRMANAVDIFSLARLAWIARRRKIDVIITNLGKEFWPATLAAKLAGTKILLVRHQLDPIKKLTSWLIRNLVDETVAVSQAVQAVMLAGNIPAGKIRVIHPGLATESFEGQSAHRLPVRAELGLAPADIVVATAGKLHHGKGIFELLQAAAILVPRHPAVKLLYVGDGPDGEALKQATAALGLDRHVVFAGFRRDIARVYAAIDIFALPSKLYESFGLVVVEAMAAEKPVVAAAVGGIPEIISHDVNGLLIAPGDPDELAEALERLIANPELGERFVRESTRLVQANFTQDAVGRKFENVVRSMVEPGC